MSAILYRLFLLHADLDFYHFGSLNNINYQENDKKRTTLSQYSLKHFAALLSQLLILLFFEGVDFFSFK